MPATHCPLCYNPRPCWCDGAWSDAHAEAVRQPDLPEEPGDTRMSTDTPPESSVNMDKTDLIDFLLAKQATAKLGDAAFAKFLGLGLSTWLRYKSRERPPTLRLAQVAANHYPKEHGTIWRSALGSQTRPVKVPA